MIGIPNTLAEGIKRGDFQVDDNAEKIITKFHEKSVLVLDTDNKLTQAPDTPQSSKNARKVYSIYKRDVKTLYDKIETCKKETQALNERLNGYTTNSSILIQDKFAQANYETCKSITDNTDTKNLEEVLENMDFADDLTKKTSREYLKKQGLKLFVDALVNENIHKTIEKLTPEKKQQVQHEFIRLTQQQLPNTHKEVLDLAITKSGEASFGSHLKSMVEVLAIENMYNPKRLFPSKIPKGSLCHFIANATLKSEGENQYFVDSKNNPMCFNQTSDTFHKTTIEFAIQNFKDFKSEYLPYLKAKENNQTGHNRASAKQNTNGTKTKPTPTFHTLKDELKYWENEKNTLLDALSSIASKRMKKGNAGLTDLSDPDRALKVAEKYSALYDDEWTDALEELQENSSTINPAIDQLKNILLESYDICKKSKSSNLLNSVHHMLEQNRVNPSSIGGFVTEWSEWLDSIEDTNSGTASAPREKETKATLVQKLSKKLNTQMNAKPDSKLASYIEKSLEICLGMVNLNPPLVFNFPEKNSAIDTNSYGVFTNSGTDVDFVVWPALLLHDDGPVLTKGVVQPIKQS